jgi:hypothetical protein
VAKGTELYKYGIENKKNAKEMQNNNFEICTESKLPSVLMKLVFIFVIDVVTVIINIISHL